MIRVLIQAFAMSLVLLSPGAAQTVVNRPDLMSVFEDRGAAGTFVLFDVSADQLVVVDHARAAQRYIPASTFKFANSLIALEVGAVNDVHEIIPYGGEPQPFRNWERDMAIGEAFAVFQCACFSGTCLAHRRCTLCRLARETFLWKHRHRDRCRSFLAGWTLENKCV